MSFVPLGGAPVGSDGRNITDLTIGASSTPTSAILRGTAKLIAFSPTLAPGSVSNASATATQGTNFLYSDWSSVTSITSNDGVAATCAIANFNTQIISMTALGMSVPAGATINGIAATVVVKSSVAADTSESLCMLTNAGVEVGAESSNTYTYGTSYQTYVYGGPTDLWGASWADTDIPNLGLDYQAQTSNHATVSLDYIGLTVYYTSSSGPAGIATSASSTQNKQTATVTQKAISSLTTPALALVKGAAKTISSTSTVAAALARRAAKAFSIPVASTLATVRSTIKKLSIASTNTFVMLRQVGKSVGSQTTPSSSTTRASARSFRVASQPVYSLLRGIGKAFAPASTPAATIVRAPSYARTFQAWVLGAKAVNAIANSATTTLNGASNASRTVVPGVTDPFGGTNTYSYTSSVTGTTTISGQQSLGVAPNRPTTASVYLKAGTKSIFRVGGNTGNNYAWFNLTTGTVGTVGSGLVTAQISDAGGGWFRCSVGYSPPNTLILFVSPADADGSNTTTVTTGDLLFYASSAQIEDGYSLSAYTAGGGSGTYLNYTTLNRGITRTFTGTGVPASSPNIYTYSEDFSQASAWSRTGLLQSSGFTDPLGGTAATALTGTAAGSSTRTLGRASLIASIAGRKETVSVYAKAGASTWVRLTVQSATFNGTNTMWFNLSTGTLGALPTGVTATITSVGDGWYRCAATVVPFGSVNSTYGMGPATGDNFTTSNSDGVTADLYVWGAQINYDVLAPYYPTTSTAGNGWIPYSISMIFLWARSFTLSTQPTYSVAKAIGKFIASVIATVAQGLSDRAKLIAPVTDVAAGSWRASTGTSLYAMVDETAPDDSDYIYTSLPGTVSFALPATTNPGTNNNFSILIRVKADNSSRSLTVNLKQSTTLIASRTFTNLPTGFNTLSFPIPPSAAASITDFSSLSIELQY